MKKSKSILSLFVGLIFAAVAVAVRIHFGDSSLSVAVATGITPDGLINPFCVISAFALPAGIINSSDLKLLYEQRGKTWEEMQAIDSKATSEKRAMNNEETAQWNEAESDMRAIDQRIKVVKVTEDESKRMAEEERARGNGGVKAESRAAFEKYIRNGYASLNAEERALVVESRTVTGQNSDTNGQGGYLVPVELSKQIEIALLAYGGAREFGEVFNTAGGGTFNWPLLNDTSSKAAIIGQLVASSAGEKTISNKGFASYTYATPAIPISWELLADAGFNVEAMIQQALIESIARGTNEHYTTGDGSTQPQGIVTGATASGITATVSAISADNLIDLQHSVNAAYRKSAKCAWMMADSTLKAIKKLKDGQGNFLFQPSFRDGAPDMILGHKYVVNDDMAAIGASAKSVIFGDGSKFKIRDVSSLAIVRLAERFADQRAVGFIGYYRTESKVLDAGTHPIKYLVHAAS